VNPRGRLVALETLVAITGLAVGFGVWSALTGPDVAVVQLRDAAENTAGAPSAEATVYATIDSSSSGTTALPNESIVIKGTTIYQAPDRQSVNEFITASTGSGTRQGGTQYTQIGSFCWYTTTCQSESALRSAGVLNQLGHTSGVSYQNGTYLVSPAASIHFVSAEFPGVFAGLGVPIIENAVVKVRISGSYVSSVQISFDAIASAGGPHPSRFASGTVKITEVARYIDIGNAPAVVRPAGPPTSVAGVSDEA
jgi:hypothetical protein